MSFETQAALAVAAVDLQTVRLLRAAMREADVAAGLLCERRLLLDRAVIRPEPRFEPRPVIQPTPYFLPRPIIHPTPRVEPTAPQLAPAPPADPSCCDSSAPALDAPWRTPVWEMSLPPAPVIKLNIHRTDVVSKGSLIDFFI